MRCTSGPREGRPGEAPPAGEVHPRGRRRVATSSPGRRRRDRRARPPGRRPAARGLEAAGRREPTATGHGRGETAVVARGPGQGLGTDERFLLGRARRLCWRSVETIWATVISGMAANTISGCRSASITSHAMAVPTSATVNQIINRRACCGVPRRRSAPAASLPPSRGSIGIRLNSPITGPAHRGGSPCATAVCPGWGTTIRRRGRSTGRSPRRSVPAARPARCRSAPPW